MFVHLTVDPDVCIGSAECVALDPDAIELDDQGCARPLLSEMDEARASRLCDACPVGALAFALQPAVTNRV